MTPTQAVLAAEADRYRAMVEGDVATLRKMCDPALRYVVSSGETESLESWLQKIGDGRFRYDRIEHPVDRVDIRGELAIVSGRMHAYASIDGVLTTISSVTTGVLVRDGSAWRLLVFQATRMS